MRGFSPGFTYTDSTMRVVFTIISIDWPSGGRDLPRRVNVLECSTHGLTRVWSDCVTGTMIMPGDVVIYDPSENESGDHVCT